MTTIPLRFIKDHLFFELPDGLFLVDTGAPQSLGPGQTLTLATVTVPLQRAFLGATLDTIKDFVGVPFTGLVGQDLLLQLDIVFDLPRQQATVSALPTLHVRREPVELRGTGFPQIPVEIGGQRQLFLLDTGAQLSLFQLDEVPSGFVPAGTGGLLPRFRQVRSRHRSWSYMKVRRAGRASRSFASSRRTFPSVWPTENVSTAALVTSCPMPSRRCRPAGT